MKKSYWVKAGTIGAGVYLSIEILALISKYTFENPSTSYGITLLGIWSYFPFGFLYETFADYVGLPSYTPLPAFLIVVLNVLIFSLIGIFISWIYRKIKKQS